MSDFASIEEFNKYNFEQYVTFEMNEYFNKIHLIFYPTYEIPFMNYFLTICEKENKYCIEQDKLVEYGALKNSHLSHVLHCLNDRGLEENVHYIIVKKQRNGIRTTNHKEVLLIPMAFKICLMRSINTDKYARYFLLLEMVYKYYCSYQNEMKNRSLKCKDDNIDFLCKKLEENKIEFKNEFEGINKQLKDVHVKLDNITNIAFEVSGRSVPSTQKKGNDHAYSLLQCDIVSEEDDSIEFMLIRGKENYVKTKEKKFKEVYTTKVSNYSPNSINFGIRLKEQISKLNSLIIKQLKELDTDHEDDPELYKYFTIDAQNNRFNVGKEFGAESFIKLIKFVDEEKYDKIKEIQW